MWAAIAKQYSKLKGKQPELQAAQDRENRRTHGSGDQNVTEIAVLFHRERADGVPVPAAHGRSAGRTALTLGNVSRLFPRHAWRGQFVWVPVCLPASARGFSRRCIRRV